MTTANPQSSAAPSDVAQIGRWVDEAVQSTPVYDLHTHIYPPSFGPLMLWGIDELITYHYLIAETIRSSDVGYDRYWAMSQKEQADLIWKTLFLEHAPLSEACRGVITVLRKMGLDLSKRDLDSYRSFFRAQKPAEYVDKCFKLANVHTVVMTNDAFDPVERDLWLKGAGKDRDPRFKAVLRIDPLLIGWPKVADQLSAQGYKAGADLGEASMREVRRFLNEWIDRMGAVYVAVSLEPSWRYPDDSATSRVIDQAIVPVCRERNLPFAVMVGVQRQVNPRLKLAGDSVGKADIRAVDRLAGLNPHNKFLCTMLSRENQHELAVTARKHRNLMIFGCWWFMNNPVIIEEITRMRMELLGPTFVPQHSDARILDQVVYKWDHSRQVIAKVLRDKFADLSNAGWKVTQDEVKQAARELLSGNFEKFLASTPSV